jgi:hypothetical protein
MTQADSFCTAKGRQMMPVNQHTQDGAFNDFGHSSLQFRCLAAGDPELGRPKLRYRPDVVIENRSN